MTLQISEDDTSPGPSEGVVSPPTAVGGVEDDVVFTKARPAKREHGKVRIKTDAHEVQESKGDVVHAADTSLRSHQRGRDLLDRPVADPNLGGQSTGEPLGDSVPLPETARPRTGDDDDRTAPSSTQRGAGGRADVHASRKRKAQLMLEQAEMELQEIQAKKRVQAARAMLEEEDT